MNTEPISPINTCDFCIAWNWEFDADFVAILRGVCQGMGLRLAEITPDNLAGMMEMLRNGGLAFRVLWNRASDSDSKFLYVDQWARERGLRVINPREKASRIWNKSRIHYVLINAGLYTPFTIVLPSFEAKPDLGPLDLSPLGTRFIIKPAHGGGGEGVVTDATTMSHVQVARQEHPGDIYLLQSFVVPVRLGGKPAWFRILCCCGEVYPCWWEPETHVYTPVTREEEAALLLGPLRKITGTIAGICGLDLFSTEIALTAEGHFVVVDYINDMIDLRLKSKAADGVPDPIVEDVVRRLAMLAIA